MSDLSTRDLAFLARAVELARAGALRVDPNPRVGCVVVRDGAVIGEGAHERFGGAHAEVNALAAAGVAARGATLYVTLEPCSTQGKTPPCCDAILASGVVRVVYAEVDPNPAHAGRARSILEARGIECSGPHEVSGASALLTRFRSHLADDRPFVIAKWAMSLDGKIATRDRDSKWITSESARAGAHRLRGDCDGIVVGGETVRRDRPRLTARPPGNRTARRIVFSRSLDLPLDWEAWTDRGPEIVLVTSRDANPRMRNGLAQFPVTWIEVEDRSNEESGFVRSALRELRRVGVARLLVEGGGRLLGSFFDARVVDQVAAFVAPRILGGADAPSAVGGTGIRRIADGIRLEELRHETLDGDQSIEGYVAS